MPIRSMMCSKIFLERGLKLIDFKIEFGIADGQVLLADGNFA